MKEFVFLFIKLHKTDDSPPSTALESVPNAFSHCNIITRHQSVGAAEIKLEARFAACPSHLS